MNSFTPKVGSGNQHGFTLVEMLVAMTILVFIMILATQMIGATSKIWKNTTAKIESFQNARDGFQLMTDELRQATLNTYWDYYDANGLTSRTAPAPFNPVAYGRQSELHFRIGKSLFQAQAQGGNTYGVFFQAPLSYTATPATYGTLQNLLNAAGFYIEFNNGTTVLNAPPTFLPTANALYRYRLVQFMQPTENMSVYGYSFANGISPTAWFAGATGPITAQHSTVVRTVATNIIGLFVWPKATDSPTDTLSTNYNYDSRGGLNSGAATTSAAAPYTWTPKATPGISPQPLQLNQLPPLLRVAMIAVDEPSMKLLIGNSNTAPSKITTLWTQNNPNTAAVVFTNPQFMDSDLLYVQTLLAAIKPHLNFRVFETTITVKAARYSTK